jgi:hypothetical protein
MITRTNITRRAFLSVLVYLGSFGFMQLGWNLDKLGTARNTNAVALAIAPFLTVR